MNKLSKGILIFFICCISFYIPYIILGYTNLSEEVIETISSLFFFLPILIYFLIIKRIVIRENEVVTKHSSKIQRLLEINSKYDFKEISRKKRRINEREYSRKSLDRVTGTSIIKYHIENNIDGLRTDIENAINNINLLDEYNKEIKTIDNIEVENKTKYSNKKFRKIEERVISNLIYKKENFLMRIKIKVYYTSRGGNVNDSRYGNYSFQQIVDIYKTWKTGNKFAETKKQERKIMNDDIRYNVLKRDNFTCQICGVTAKDGAKLHVDHIIPVSKGGKTVMRNLQTLCDRCNIGKSNKTDDAIDDNMICPECGGKLVRRKGKYGTFIGCSNYPKCRYTR